MEHAIVVGDWGYLPVGGLTGGPSGDGILRSVSSNGASAMRQNAIQFGCRMSLSTFGAKFGSESACEAVLLRARWPDGFVCPACGERARFTFVVNGRRYWQCAHCRAQTRLRSGTLFHAARLPLTKWFQAIDLVTQHKGNLSALSLKRHLGVCYRTTGRVKHKLLQAMVQPEGSRIFNGAIFGDDAVLGGVDAGKPDRGSRNNCPFSAAVELDDDGRPQHVRFDAVDNLKGVTLATWAERALHPDVHVVTDGLANFASGGAVVAEYGALIVRPRKSSDLEPLRSVNTLISNLKTAISGTYHHVNFAKQRHRDLAEAQYRVSRRFDLPSLVGRLVHACARTQPCRADRLR